MTRLSKSTQCDVSNMSNLERRQFLRSLCPCRTNSSENLDGWRDLFTQARFGSYSERKAAAHSIGTLLEKAQKSTPYRNLLKEFQEDLDELMKDPRAASQVLGVMKKHGHAHKGAARKNYRHAYAVFSVSTHEEIANWLNDQFQLTRSKALSSDSTVVRQLTKWLRHRTKFEPTRKISDAVVIERAQRLMPSLSTAIG